MIRRNGEYRTEVREAMRGGSGSVKMEHFWQENELDSAARLCARLTLEPGCSIGLHPHDGEEEIFIIVRGEAEVDDDGVKSRVKAGDTILTGNGAKHAISNVGSGTLEIVAVIVKFQ